MRKEGYEIRRGDTQIPTVDRAHNTIESDGGSSVDSEVFTHLFDKIGTCAALAMVLWLP
jgi:hypothetical protein